MKHLFLRLCFRGLDSFSFRNLACISIVLVVVNLLHLRGGCRSVKIIAKLGGKLHFIWQVSNLQGGLISTSTCTCTLAISSLECSLLVINHVLQHIAALREVLDIRLHVLQHGLLVFLAPEFEGTSPPLALRIDHMRP